LTTRKKVFEFPTHNTAVKVTSPLEVRREMTMIERERGLTEKLEEASFGGCTLRVRKARQRALSTVPSICLEKAKIMTEVFMKTEGEPLIIRKAKSFEEL
jgi:hypothetical protein